MSEAGNTLQDDIDNEAIDTAEDARVDEAGKDLEDPEAPEPADAASPADAPVIDELVADKPAEDAQPDVRPMFSIVMPAYNVEKYVARAIECVKAQTFTNWELIVVDDASTDNTAEAVKQAMGEDPRIRLVQHEENQWLSGARNTGLDEARGEYIWFCDSDDTYDKTLLECCAKSINFNASDVIVFGHTEMYYDEHGNHMYDNTIEPKGGVYLSKDELRPHILDLEQSTCYGYAWNKAYRLDYLHDCGVRFERITLIEDITFNVKVFQDIDSLNVVSKPLYNYAKRMGSNITNSFDKDYYPKHKARIQMLRDQQESWGLLDDQALSILGSLYGRYILSAIERNLDKRSGMSSRDRTKWLEEVFDDPLFNELIPHAEAKDSTALEVCLIPLKDKRVKGTLRLGHMIHFARNHATSSFDKIKSGR